MAHTRDPRHMERRDARRRRQAERDTARATSLDDLGLTYPTWQTGYSRGFSQA